MNNYKHILVAVDLSETSKVIVQRAQQMSIALSCKLSLIQSIESYPIDISPDGVIVDEYDKVENFQDYAYKSLKAIANSLEINNPEIYPMIGTAKEEIAEFAKKNNVDLIVVGFHENHGLFDWFKTTTDDIVHNSPCDVLAVHC